MYGYNTGNKCITRIGILLVGMIRADYSIEKIYETLQLVRTLDECDVLDNMNR